jgi:hypothetical protein
LGEKGAEVASKWFCEPSIAAPDTLVQVDAFEAKVMSRARPQWRRDDSYLSWSWDSTGLNLTRAQAAKIAARWGTKL